MDYYDWFLISDIRSVAKFNFAADLHFAYALDSNLSVVLSRDSLIKS